MMSNCLFFGAFILLGFSMNVNAQETLTREETLEKFKDGNYYLNMYNYEKALESYSYCNNIFVECANNTGVAYLKLDDNESAAKWFTLAAQNGFSMSIETLKKMGRPIPKIINNNQNNNASNNDQNYDGLWNAVNTLLNSYNRGLESQLQNRRRNTSCTTIGNSIDCYDY